MNYEMLRIIMIEKEQTYKIFRLARLLFLVVFFYGEVYGAGSDRRFLCGDLLCVGARILPQG